MKEPVLINKQDLEEIIAKSHNSLATSYSNSFGEVKTDVAVIKEMLSAIKDDNTRRNGSFKEAMVGFTEYMKTTDVRVQSLELSRATASGGIQVFNIIWTAIVAFVSAGITVYFTKK